MNLFCAVLCTLVVHSCMHTNMNSSQICVGLGLDFIFVCSFRFCILYSYCVSVVIILFYVACFLVLGLVSLVPSQKIGWEEHLQNDLFCVEWDIKP